MRNLWFIAFSLFFVLSCKTTKNTVLDKNDVLLDEIKVEATRHPYRASAEMKNDLLHTKLKVSFDLEKQYLYGEAWLTLKPFFYTTNQVELDAKGMDIEKVSLVDGTDLNFEYNKEKLIITLDREYTRQENYSVYIKYISKPNELEKTPGLSAIKDDKGLYFINPLGEEEDKPTQIWTQGEPESNSVWFPTIDKPNERCTQEISMTVENRFLAMSNGYLVSDIDNGDGTHTVSWKQDKPHAPYLFMMTIGDFAQIKDDWKGMSVDYFVEYEYENVAQEIFGNTPEMLTYFSEVLGVEYQWDKYWQVCVRDYVSGAMENTSAVIFGEFVQLDERELLDDSFTEDIVAHELFHHWFGDLVTCESWANLPLNESFATYGEVMWREYKYGEDEKLRKVYDDMQAYFNEASRGKQVDMIRYHHDTAEDMFDSHSYAKGGTILNMLRDVVGDDAFFTSLKTYLEDNKFQSVEIHNLRLAFEKVTGQDLNWFFNQWFLSAGHPEITIDYVYTDSSVVVKMKQTPSAESNLVYRLPMQIDIYDANDLQTKHIVFDKKEQEFEFLTKTTPLLVDVDANKSLLAIIKNNQTQDNLIFQAMNGKNMLSKLYAMQQLSLVQKPSAKVKDVFTYALEDDYWFIQEYAANNYPIEATDIQTIEKLKDLAVNAPNSSVRAASINALSVLENKSFEPIFTKGLSDLSYAVNASALEAMMYINPEVALAKAKEWENLENYGILDAIGNVYSEIGGEDKIEYFEKNALEGDDQYTRIYAVYYYSKFLSRMKPNKALEGVDFIEKFGKTDESSFAKNVALSSLRRIQNGFNVQVEILKNEANAEGNSKSQKLAIESEMLDYVHVIENAEAAMERLSATK